MKRPCSRQSQLVEQANDSVVPSTSQLNGYSHDGEHDGETPTKRRKANQNFVAMVNTMARAAMQKSFAAKFAAQQLEIETMRKQREADFNVYSNQKEMYAKARDKLTEITKRTVRSVGCQTPFTVAKKNAAAQKQPVVSVPPEFAGKTSSYLRQSHGKLHGISPNAFTRLNGQIASPPPLKQMTSSQLATPTTTAGSSPPSNSFPSSNRVRSAPSLNRSTPSLPPSASGLQKHQLRPNHSFISGVGGTKSAATTSTPALTKMVPATSSVAGVSVAGGSASVTAVPSTLPRPSCTFQQSTNSSVAPSSFINSAASSVTLSRGTFTDFGSLNNSASTVPKAEEPNTVLDKNANRGNRLRNSQDQDDDDIMVLEEVRPEAPDAVVLPRLMAPGFVNPSNYVPTLSVVPVSQEKLILKWHDDNCSCQPGDGLTGFEIYCIKKTSHPRFLTAQWRKCKVVDVMRLPMSANLESKAGSMVGMHFSLRAVYAGGESYGPFSNVVSVPRWKALA